MALARVTIKSELDTKSATLLKVSKKRQSYHNALENDPFHKLI